MDDGLVHVVNSNIHGWRPEECGAIQRTDFSLEELRGFVGGHIELVRLSKSQVMVVNEEGKVYDLPQNENATMLVNIAGIRDVIVGNVLVCDINKIK